MSRARDRLGAIAFGRRAEWVAAAFLTAKGWRVLARGYRVRGGEIDVIARRGATVIFVEVKARPTLDEALIAITPGKIARMSRAARYWLAANPWASGCVLRGDAVFLAPWRWPTHLADAAPLRLD